jgi:hypothetical protein
MGRRVRFFMYGNDELIFLEEIKNNFDLLLDEKSEPLKELVKPEIMRSLFITIPNSNISKWQNGDVDPLMSEVIHFIRSIVEEKNQLWEGGLWIETKFYGDKNQLVIKPDWLTKKFNVYKKWVTKNLRPNKDKSIYIGEEAYKLYKEQGFQMKNAPKVNIEFN